MSWLNKATGFAQNFFSSKYRTANEEVLFPVSETLSSVYAAVIPVTVREMINIVNVGALTGDATINLTIEDQVSPGAEIILNLSASGAQRNVTLGTGTLGNVIAIGSGDSISVFLKYNGTDFVLINIGIPGPAGTIPAADVQSPAFNTTIAVTVTENSTILNVAQMTDDATLNITIDPAVEAGAILVVKAKSDTTARDLTPGTGMTGKAVAGVISKTNYAQYIYDGTTFVHVSTMQVD